MPDVSDVREIIPARVCRAAPPTALALRHSPPRSARRFASSAAYLSTRRCATQDDFGTHSDTFRHLWCGNSWGFSKPKLGHFLGYTWLCLALDGSRWLSMVPDSSRWCLNVHECCPVSALSGCPVTHDPPRVGGHPTRNLGPDWPSPAFGALVRRPGGVPYLETNCGDSKGSRIRSCRRLPALPTTCARGNSRTSSSSRRGHCADGDGKERARTLSGTAESSGTGAMTSILGHGRLTNLSVLEKCRCGGPPWPGRTAASVESAEKVGSLRPASLTVRPWSREVPVILTLARLSPLRTHHPCLISLMSHLISAGPVTS